MRSSTISLNAINRQTLENFEIQPIASQINVKLNVFNFSDPFDISIQVPLDKKPKIKSHSFVEFFVDVNRAPFQIAAGYLEDFVTTSDSDKITMSANGKTLIGQLMNSNFKKTLYAENSELGSFINATVKGEYVEQYNKLKGRSGMIIDNDYNRATFLASSDQFQMKGQIIERYCKLSCTLIYQDRLGRIVLTGNDHSFTQPLGRLIWAKNRSNIKSLNIRENFSETYSSATIFYTQSEAQTDVNAAASVQYQNTDPRVKGVISRPYYETFNVSDIQHFAGKITPEARMSQIARSSIRISNRKINQVIISTDTPYFFDTVKREFIPYELLQVWEIESDQNDLTDIDNPNGTNVVKMILTGIDYSATEDALDVQLQFTDFNTLT
jgi:hypothetical protein